MAKTTVCRHGDIGPQMVERAWDGFRCLRRAAFGLGRTLDMAKLRLSGWPLHSESGHHISMNQGHFFFSARSNFHITGKEVLEANVQAESDSRFDSLRYVINDFLDCTGLTVLPDDIVEIAAIDKAASTSNPNIRIAIVATSPEVLAAADAYANDPLAAFTIRLFNSMNEAESWVA